VSRLLVFALVFATGCANRNEPQTAGTPGPVPKLDGRWWLYPQSDPVDIKGANVLGISQIRNPSGSSTVSDHIPPCGVPKS